MRSLPLLVLLLFAVVVHTVTSASPSAAQALMEELVANGVPQRLKSFNDLYLTEDIASTYLLTLPRQDWGRFQAWTIVQINDHEVSIRSTRGNYIGHGTSDWAQQAEVDKKWEMLTPVKNAGGTWSFKSQDNKWLSGHYYKDVQKYYISFESDNSKCEKWRLEPYIPPANPLMDELLANGGRWRFKAFDEAYITEGFGVGLLPGSHRQLVMAEENLEEDQQWTIIQVNENEVVLESRHKIYIKHGQDDIALRADAPDYWELLTPVKNNYDGSWSFKSRDNKWLSGTNAYRPIFLPIHGLTDHWWLQPN